VRLPVRSLALSGEKPGDDGDRIVKTGTPDNHFIPHEGTSPVERILLSGHHLPLFIDSN
jgi:hypothetical protein